MPFSHGPDCVFHCTCTRRAAMSLLWSATVLLCLNALLHWDVCVGQRAVHIQEGPLYRAMGYPFTMSCNVTGFKGSPQQTFEFSIKRLASPNQEIKIISTAKSNFPYAVYQRRVLNGDIQIQRLTGSSALLEIDNLLEGDGGEYDCHTPNTDVEYFGSYSAKTVLHVIQDTLSASASPTGLHRAEGESVALECEVSSQTFQHTHLSVTWFLQSDKASQPRPIISLTRDFTLSPGAGFEGRYRAGFISLDKVQETTYRLSISQLQLTDEGSLYCQASEWIQDPDRSWYRIAFKNAEAFTLQIQPIERNLAVSAPSSTTKANEGDVLRVTCSVSGTSGQLSVSWQHRPEQGSFGDVISLSRNGVMEPGVRYRQRAETGDVRTLRATPDNVTLEIANALPSDSGTYRCTVSEWVTEPYGNVKNIDTQSQELNTEVLSVDSLISVNLKGRTVRVKENEEIELYCKVLGPKFPLSVNWTFKPSASPSQEQIVSLLPNGVITWWKNQRSYHIRTQVQQDRVSFILKVFRASVQEAGTYQCVVEAFLRQTRRSLKLSNELAVLVRKPDSRLSVSTGSRAALEHAVGSDVRMECSVLTVTTNTSRFAVSWLFQREGGPNRTFLSADRDSVLQVDGGQKYSLVRPKARSYNLLLRNAGTGDSGKYHCVLEEWLQDPHGDWAPLASKSAVIQLLITQQESRFSVTKGESKVTVQESEQVHLNCTLGPGSVTPTSHYSVTWFFVPVSSSDRMTLVRFSHDALLDYTGVNAELMKRMSFYRPALGSFSLAIRNMDAQDSGRYFCQVDEYLLDCEGEWLQRATDQSGVTSVSVRQTESNLHVAKDNSSVTMDNQQGSFVISCNITSRSSAGSVFEVTWWRRQADGGGEPHPIFRARRDFTLEHLVKSRERLVLGRPRADLYTLTVPDAEPSDSGHYYCHVEEWLLSPRHTWRKIAQDTSGYLAVSFQTQAGANFTVLKPNGDVSVQEGGDMFLTCKLGPGSVTRASHYSFTWFFVPANSSERMTLVRFSHDALLDYTGVNAELRKRMHFYRSALGSFSLAIHNMDAQDSGRYSCQVDEYLLDCEGEWLQRATDQSGVTTVSVHQTESALRLQKGDDNVTVSDQQGSFVISCNITSRSSAGSVFEVTWWRRQADGGREPRPIFRARRDFTLEHLGRERLVLGRPRADLYTLTVPDAEPSDSGHYYCHVEEWLLSPRHTWRKIAQDTSGYLAVSFQTQGDGSQREAPCASGMLPVVLSVLIVLLLLGIGVLAYKLRKAGSWSANRKSDRSLWAESNPLKPKLET